TVCVTPRKPLMSMLRMYSPGGRNGIRKSPLLDVTTLLVPCNAGEATVTVAPGTGRLSGSTTCPLIAPVGLPCAAAPAAASTAAMKTTAARNIAVLLLLRRRRIYRAGRRGSIDGG